MKFPNNCKRSAEDFVGSLFFKLGFLVGTWPWIFFILPLLVTIICGYGFSKFGEINDVYEQFTPIGSPSRRERDAWLDFVGDKYTKEFQTAQPIVVKAKNNQRLFDRFGNDSSNALMKELKYIEKSFSIKYNNSLFTYQNFCAPFCKTNTPFRLFVKAFDKRRYSNNSNIKLFHPIIRIFGIPINVGVHIYAVKKDRYGNVNSVDMVQWHFSGSSDQSMQEYINKWREALYQYVNNNRKFDMYTLLNTAFNAEIRRAGISALPLFGISFAIMVTFSVLTTLRADCVHSKPLEAVAGVMSPIFAIIASFGLLIFLGLKFQPMVTVSFFLVLAIGVDDMFIMLHTWHETYDKSLGVAERMGHCLRSSGPSITITSLTNTLSFAIGISTTTPAIRTFCLFTSTALLVDYIFQLTYFAALLSISGRREANNKNSCICCLKQPKGDSGIYRPFIKQINNFYEKMIECLTKAILMDKTAILVLIGLAVYWAIAIWGWSIVKIDIHAAKLLLADSPHHRWLKIEEKLFNEEMNMIAVVVSNPGNLSDYSNRRTQLNLVGDFANLDHRYSLNDSSAFWLESYLRYTSFFGIDFSYTLLDSFLQTRNHAVWESFIRKNLTACELNLPDCVSKFTFAVGYRGLSDWKTRTRLVKLWRTILERDKYKDLKASLFYGPTSVCDQISTIGPITRNTLLTTMFCMALICAIFVPDLYITPFTVGVMLSINVGVFGFASLWGVDLDPIALAGLLMTIGFSVDFNAHVIYHYYKSDSQGLEEKLLHTYKMAAWPMLQAGTSTILCLGVLSTHNSYLILTFVKTVMLSVILGVTHGLVILPIGLSNITRLRRKWVAKRNIKQTEVGMKTFEENSKAVNG